MTITAEEMTGSWRFKITGKGMDLLRCMFKDLGLRKLDAWGDMPSDVYGLIANALDW